ncbi:hypothetical protein F0L74_31535 [Chitinophaga agrisoli]|uniref:Uncharacterized protein n=1 Tax=Chitinophaga agrisoli TaxID=2607653 RepID=A0A5B2VPS2_9BACT|nr:hypothetical protein [Chitinophaga agrisoli]KAA2240678.1 hypothetical protein F0L74_31535 [Chitinophaga agrisoli]
MKYLLTAVFVWTQALAIFAQSADTTKTRKIKTIHLKARQYRAKGETLIPLSGVRVIPVCADTTQLGFIPKGLKYAVPDRPYTSFLQDYVNDMLRNVYKGSGMQMLWIIKDLRVNEGPGAIVRLKADAWLSADKQHYRLLKTFDTILVQQALYVTQVHDDNIAHALQVFYIYCDLAVGTAASDPALTEAEIVAREQEKFRAPIYIDTVYKEGVYLSYKEFLANAPSVTDYDISVRKNKVTIYAREVDSSCTELDAPWGLSKKGELYKYDLKELVPLERKANSFIVTNYMSEVRKSNNLATWSVISPTVALASLLFWAPKVHPSPAVPQLGDEKPMATTVDPYSGEFVF